MNKWNEVREAFKKLEVWDVVIRKMMVSRSVDGKRYVEAYIAEVKPNNIHPSYLTVIGRNLTYEEANIIVKIHNLGEGNGNS